MNKKNILIIIISVIVILLASLGIFLSIKCQKVTVTEDMLKFKEEYTSLNGKDTSNGKKYLTIDIKDNNMIKYSSYDEIFDILKDKTGIIYFGFPECPWCRNIIPVLTKTVSENYDGEIYYLNNRVDRDEKELNKKGKVVTTKEGTEDYNKLLEILKDVLPEYRGLNNPDIKRLYLPTVVFVKEGKILGIVRSLEEFQTRVNGDGYQEMTTEEKEKLSNIYIEYINKLK